MRGDARRPETPPSRRGSPGFCFARSKLSCRLLLPSPAKARASLRAASERAASVKWQTAGPPSSGLGVSSARNRLCCGDR